MSATHAHDNTRGGVQTTISLLFGSRFHSHTVFKLLFIIASFSYPNLRLLHEMANPNSSLLPVHFETDDVRIDDLFSFLREELTSESAPQLRSISLVFPHQLHMETFKRKW